MVELPGIVVTGASGRMGQMLVLLPGGHFDPYIAGLAQAGGAARDWFVEQLKP